MAASTPSSDATMEAMTLYQFFLLAVLIAWPLAILGALFLMSRLERYVKRLDAADPGRAGLEPVEGTSREKEVRVVFGDTVVGEPDPAAAHPDSGPQPATARVTRD